MEGRMVSKVGIYLFLNSRSPWTAAYHQIMISGEYRKLCTVLGDLMGFSPRIGA